MQISLVLERQQQYSGACFAIYSRLDSNSNPSPFFFSFGSSVLIPVVQMTHHENSEEATNLTTPTIGTASSLFIAVLLSRSRPYTRAHAPAPPSLSLVLHSLSAIQQVLCYVVSHVYIFGNR